MANNVLVTGASGFIGKRLVKELLERGDQVRCLVRPTSDVADLERTGCRLVFGDLFLSLQACLMQLPELMSFITLPH